MTLEIKPAYPSLTVSIIVYIMTANSNITNSFDSKKKNLGKLNREHFCSSIN